MTESSTAEATGALTEAQAAERFAQMLDPQVQGEASETETEESQEAEETEAEAEETDAERSEDDADAEEAPAEQPQTLTVKIDGQDVVVTLEEALAGYQRTADYTRKTQALAQERKALDGEKQAFTAERARTTELLTVLEQQLQGQTDNYEALQELRQTDPAEYAARMADNMERQRRIEAVQAERSRILAQQAQDEARARQAIVAEEQGKLLQVLPAWKDPEVFKAETAKLADYVRSLGFTDEDLADITDHRMIRVLHDAQQFRALKAKAPQLKPAAPKPLAIKPAQPGTTRKPVSDTTRAKQRLAKTGREADAQAVFLSMLPD